LSTVATGFNRLRADLKARDPHKRGACRDQKHRHDAEKRDDPAPQKQAERPHFVAVEPAAPRAEIAEYGPEARAVPFGRRSGFKNLPCWRRRPRPCNPDPDYPPAVCVQIVTHPPDARVVSQP
jgi:hypothetical protein